MAKGLLGMENGGSNGKTYLLTIKTDVQAAVLTNHADVGGGSLGGQDGQGRCARPVVVSPG